MACSKDEGEKDEGSDADDIEQGSEADAVKSQWSFDSKERDYQKEAEPDIADALPQQNSRNLESESAVKIQANPHSL